MKNASQGCRLATHRQYAGQCNIGLSSYFGNAYCKDTIGPFLLLCVEFSINLFTCKTYTHYFQSVRHQRSKTLPNSQPSESSIFMSKTNKETHIYHKSHTNCDLHLKFLTIPCIWKLLIGYICSSMPTWKGIFGILNDFTPSEVFLVVTNYK